MTLAIPKDLHEIIKEHKEVKWSEIARQAMWNYAQKLEFMDKILSQSKLTEEDVLEISRKLNKSIARHHRLNK